MWHAGFEKTTYSTMFDYDFDLAIWYPTLQQESVTHYSQWYDGNVAECAKVAKGKFPVIAFSCGYGGSHYDQAYLAESLARIGFIVVGFSRQEFEKKNGIQGWGVKRIWYRAYEMKLAVQYVMTRWRDNIDNPASVSLFGFSAGAFTSLLLAGARPKFEQKPDFKINLKEVLHYHFTQVYDVRVKNLVLMAPIFSEVFSVEQLKKVTQPTLLLTVEKDEVIKDSAEKYKEYLPSVVEYYCLRHPGHYIFNGSFNAIASRVFSNTPVNRLDQELYHPFISSRVVNFLKKQVMPELLGENCDVS